jgi:hypothetical protein
LRTPSARNAANSALCCGKIATPAGRTAAGSTAFSRATPSSPPSSAVCAAATRVLSVRSGSIIAASGAISPGALIPASMTANRCTAGSSRVSVSGTPRWLLRLPSVASTPPAAPPSSSASRFLVEVLPALPEMPTTGPVNVRRCACAIA